MEDRKEKGAPWLSVPQFGDWDQKGVLPDYSMDFSKIRENRKYNKSRASLGNEEELNSSSATSNSNVMNTAQNNDQNYHQNHSPTPTTRRSIFSYFNCCVKA
ncbi:hypothetical protein HAX54_006048 [Datura stramonium]|uniref:RIN4 pathogenic type III effector avirulence factor Avr cleavage site domain-containing protein n=1 Tax=Datura stramonium TaxID=4076 RepID=A0ABS8RUA7_DATST|nr:hypothetical protein [Datura stramonium]